MKRSNRLILLIGIFLALVAFVLIIFMLGGGSGAQTGRATPVPSTANVVVAAKDIDLGEKIQADQVTLKEIPLNAKPANAYEDTSFVIGQVARTSVTAGQLITTTVLSDTGAVGNIEVPAGFTAMSVRVDQTTGVGTIVKAGDFVDVVTGFTTQENVKVVIPDLDLTKDDVYAYKLYPQEEYNETSVKVLAQGLQVLGTLLPPPPQGEAQPSPSAGTGGGTTTLTGQEQIVILSVPTQLVEVLKFSQIDGDISLVLRSSEDCTTKPTDGVTYCPAVATTGITLRRLVDDFGVLPPQVVQVVQPTPLPGTIPARTPRP